MIGIRFIGWPTTTSKKAENDLVGFAIAELLKEKYSESQISLRMLAYDIIGIRFSIKSHRRTSYPPRNFLADVIKFLHRVV